MQCASVGKSAEDLPGVGKEIFMNGSIYVAIQVYLYAFVISLLIAGLIRLMLWTIRRFSPKAAAETTQASAE